MAANVESMFYVREVPWHGLGTKVLEAPSSKEALRIAGLDWKVIQQPVYTLDDDLIHGYKVNVRDNCSWNRICVNKVIPKHIDKKLLIDIFL